MKAISSLYRLFTFLYSCKVMYPRVLFLSTISKNTQRRKERNLFALSAICQRFRRNGTRPSRIGAFSKFLVGGFVALFIHRLTYIKLSTVCCRYGPLPYVYSWKRKHYKIFQAFQVSTDVCVNSEWHSLFFNRMQNSGPIRMGCFETNSMGEMA